MLGPQIFLLDQKNGSIRVRRGALTVDLTAPRHKNALAWALISATSTGTNWQRWPGSEGTAVATLKREDVESLRVLLRDTRDAIRGKESTVIHEDKSLKIEEFGPNLGEGQVYFDVPPSVDLLEALKELAEGTYPGPLETLQRQVLALKCLRVITDTDDAAAARSIASSGLSFARLKGMSRSAANAGSNEQLTAVIEDFKRDRSCIVPFNVGTAEEAHPELVQAGVDALKSIGKNSLALECRRDEVAELLRFCTETIRENPSLLDDTELELVELERNLRENDGTAQPGMPSSGNPALLVCKVDEVTWEMAGVSRPVAEFALTADHQVPYVTRMKELELSAKVAAARKRNGATVIIVEGESTAGKTRMAYEVIRRLCGDAWFVAPETQNAAQKAFDLSTMPEIDGGLPVVIWLDDLERFTASYDGSDDGLGRHHLRAVEKFERPVIVMCTQGGKVASAIRGDANAGSRMLAVNGFSAACEEPVRLTRELGPTELRAAGEALPNAQANELAAGIGSLVLARDTLRQRYETGVSGNPRCTDRGDLAEGQALVDALLLLRSTIAPAPVDDQLAQAAWKVTRASRDCPGRASDRAWELAEEWATCAAVPNYPLARFDEATDSWQVADMLDYPGEPRVTAHQKLGSLIDRWCGEHPERLMVVSLRAIIPEPELASEDLRVISESYVDRALHIDPETRTAMGLKARLLELRGELKLAKEHYRRAVAGQFADPVTLGNWSRFLIEHGTPKEAETALRRACEVSRKADSFVTYAFFLQSQGRTEEAEARCLEATQIEPASMLVWIALGSFYETVNARASAQNAYEKAVALGEPSAEIRAALLDCRLREHFNAAEYEELIELSDHPDVRPEVPLRAATHLSLQEDHEQALILLRRAAIRWPDAEELQSRIGIVSESLDDADSAINAYRAAAELNPDYFPVYLQAVQRLHGTDAADNLVQSTAASCSVPSDILLAAELARAVKNGEIASADAVVAGATESDLKNPRVAYNRALLELLRDDRRAARALLEQATTAQPPFAEAHGELGRMLFEDGDLDGARAQLKIMLSLNRQSRPAIAGMAALDDVRGESQSEFLISALEDDSPEAAIETVAAWLDWPDDPEQALTRLEAGLAEDQGRVLMMIPLLDNAGTPERVERAAALFDPTIEEHFNLARPYWRRRVARNRAAGRTLINRYLFQYAPLKQSRVRPAERVLAAATDDTAPANSSEPRYFALRFGVDQRSAGVFALRAFEFTDQAEHERARNELNGLESATLDSDAETSNLVLMALAHSDEQEDRLTELSWASAVDVTARLSAEWVLEARFDLLEEIAGPEEAGKLIKLWMAGLVILEERARGGA